MRRSLALLALLVPAAVAALPPRSGAMPPSQTPREEPAPRTGEPQGEDGPAPTRPTRAIPAADEVDPYAHLVPGELPADTSAELREQWRRVVTSMRTEGVPPVSAFKLVFDLRWKPSEQQSNDLTEAAFTYLVPGFVRATLQSSRSLVRGPEGDFLIDGDEVVRLEGRELAEDKRQLDDIVNIARNFLSITDPSALRIARLEACGAPTSLPPKWRKDGEGLGWLRLESPDFHTQTRAADLDPRRGAGAAQTPSMYRVRAGYAPDTGRLALVEISRLHRFGEGSDPPVLFKIEEYFERDGFHLPRHVALYELDEAAQEPDGFVFRSEPTSDLWLYADQVKLRAELTPADFLPPAKPR